MTNPDKNPRKTAPPVIRGSRPWLDGTLIAVSLAISAGVTMLVFSDYSLFGAKSVSGNSQLVATVTDSENTVRRKPAALPVWKPARRESSLYEGDQIFTGEASGAGLSFRDGAKVTLGEKSLVVISQQRNSPVLDLVKGSVFAGSQTGGKGTVRIRTSSGDIVLDDADDQLRATKSEGSETIHLQVLSGSAKLVRPGKKQGEDLTSGRSWSLQPDEKPISRKVSARLLTPAPAEKIKQISKSNPLDFRWQGRGEEWIFRLSSHSSGSSALLRKQVSGRHLQWSSPLSPGTYYWAVRKPGADEKAAATAHFRVLEAETVNLLAPLPGRSIRARRSAAAEGPQKKGPLAAKTLFRWSSGSRQVRVELSADPVFDDPILSKELSRTALESPELKPGTYYWRVRPVGDGVTAPWTSVWSFRVVASGPATVSKKASSAPPVPKAPQLQDRYDLRLPRQ